MDRRGALLIAAAVVLGLGIHGALQLLAARQAAEQQPRANARPAAVEIPEEQAKHWQRQDALRERALHQAEAQRQWERAFWGKVFDEARELLRLKPRTATYQLIRVEGGEVVLLNTATGDLLKKPLPK